MKRNVRVMASAWTAIPLSGLLTVGCGGASEQTAAPKAKSAAQETASAAGVPANVLAGTEWRLVETQSMDDAQGTTRPADPSLYTMRLSADGTVAMRLNCNRATGSWSAEPGADGTSGRFEFGPLAGTRAFCPPPSLDEQVTAQAQYIRSFLLKDGRLHLSLMADGGIWVWEPDTDVRFEAEPDAAIEAAILKASPAYVKAVVDAKDRSAWARYIYSRVDLNGDGRDEVLVYLLGSVFCGTGGCTMQVFTRAEDGYALVGNFPTSRTPVSVSAAKTGGWNDILRLESGGGMAPSYVRHAFDGTQYVERGRTPGGTAPEGKRYLVGELTATTGIPLEPGDKAAGGPSAPAPSATGFATVCGVTVGGKDYRYRCAVEGAAPGSSGTTALHFPDNAVTITWLSGGKATATFSGMVPQDITVTTADGVTRFPFENKVYFYVSDRAKAASELKTLR